LTGVFSGGKDDCIMDFCHFLLLGLLSLLPTGRPPFLPFAALVAAFFGLVIEPWNFARRTENSSGVISAPQ
jgi:hypothetical protein